MTVTQLFNICKNKVNMAYSVKRVLVYLHIRNLSFNLECKYERTARAQAENVIPPDYRAHVCAYVSERVSE